MKDARLRCARRTRMRKVKAYSSASKDERAVAAWELLNAVMLAPLASMDPPERLLQYPETVRCRP